MRHFDTSYFCDKGKVPKVRVSYYESNSYPYVLTFEGEYPHGSIKFHIDSTEDLIYFVDSIREALLNKEVVE